MLPSQKRRQPLCNNITGKDVNTLTANTTILQTDVIPVMYLFINAHCSTHVTLDANDVPHVNALIKREGIHHTTISPVIVGPSAETSMNNISVAYYGSVQLFSL